MEPQAREVHLPAPYENYYLSPLKESDFPRLVELYNNTDLAHILSSPPFPYTINDAQWFHDNVANKRLPNYPDMQEFWAIRSRKDDGLLAGGFGTHPSQTVLPIYQSAEDNGDVIKIGYYLAPEFRGKGIIPVVIREVLKLFPNARFEAEAEISNERSQKVLIKSGFSKLEGFEARIKWPESKGGELRELWKFVREASESSLEE